MNHGGYQWAILILSNMKLMNPIFIGSFRSGTTALVNLLGLHEEITPWFETKGLCEPLRWLRVLANPRLQEAELELTRPVEIRGFGTHQVADRIRDDIKQTASRISGAIVSGKGDHEHYPIGNDYVLYSLESGLAAVDIWEEEVSSLQNLETIQNATGKLILSLSEHHLRKSGKSICINKTPEITRFGSELSDCLGPCKTIFVLRNGKEVVISAKLLDWGEKKLLAHWWKTLIRESRAHGVQNKDSYLEILYEDYVNNPEKEADRALEFIGLKYCGNELVSRYRNILANKHQI